MIRGIVFDLDGVLIDSSGCHREAFEEVLRDFTITDFVYANYAGWRTPEVFSAVLEQAGIVATPAMISEAAQRKSRLAREKLAMSNPVNEHCVTVLEQLSEKYLLALASSGSRPSVDWFLDTNRCRRFFRSVLSGNDVREAKPAPEIYSRSFEALALTPAECIVVEDAISGVQAGRGAGGAVIGLSGTCNPQELLAAGAQRVIPSLNGLLQLLL